MPTVKDTAIRREAETYMPCKKKKSAKEEKA
jgi:hypothetical protein